MKGSIECGNWDSEVAEPLSIDGKSIGVLMPQASEATLEASPGIQSWSHPRGKVSTELFDGGNSIASFSDYWAAKHQQQYPFG